MKVGSVFEGEREAEVEMKGGVKGNSLFGARLFKISPPEGNGEAPVTPPWQMPQFVCLLHCRKAPECRHPLQIALQGGPPLSNQAPNKFPNKKLSTNSSTNGSPLPLSA